MNVISKNTLVAFAQNHPDAEQALDDWYRHMRKAEYACFADVKGDYRSADWVEGYIVFNICGNRYRLIVTSNFQYKTFWIKFIGTHKEYDAWKP